MFRRTDVEAQDRDLGFGSLAHEDRPRLVNRDGSFAVARVGRGFSFLALSWTIVHPIDDTSPLRDMTAADFEAARGEVIVLLRGQDSMTSQDLHDWTIRMDVGRIDEIEPAPADDPSR